VPITYSIDAVGCDNFKSTDSIYVYECAVNDIQRVNALEVTLYPNPANDMIWIKTNVAGPKYIQISETSGKVVFEGKVQNSEEGISIANMPNGMYIVSVVVNGIRTNQIFVKN